MNKDQLSKLLLKVDDTTLDKDDFSAVSDEVSELAGHWRAMCTALGLLNDKEIYQAKLADPGECLAEVLRQWLNKEYNAARHGLPTWRKLVEAVAKRAGGSNPALAERIAARHEKQQAPVQPTDNSSGIHPPMYHQPSQLQYQQLGYPSFQHPDQLMGYQQPNQQLGQQTSYLPNQRPYQPPSYQPNQLPSQQLNQPQYQQPSQLPSQLPHQLPSYASYYQQPNQLGQPTSHLPNQPPNQQPSQLLYQQPTQPMGYQQPSQLSQPTSHLPNQPPDQQSSQLLYQQPNPPMGYQQPNQRPDQQPSQVPYQQPEQPPLQQLPTQQSHQSAHHQLGLSTFSVQSNGSLPSYPIDPSNAATQSSTHGQTNFTAQNLIPHPIGASTIRGHRVAADSSSSTIAKSEYSDFTIVADPPNSALFSNPTGELFQSAFPVKHWKGLAEIHHHKLKDGNYLRGGGTVLTVLDMGMNVNHAALSEPGKLIATPDYVGDGIGSHREMSDHGTHCAGVAAGLPYNNAYIASNRVSTIDYPGGVAPDAKLVMSRVGSKGVIFKEAVHLALSDLEKPGHLRADVISMSFGIHGNDRQQWRQLLKPTIDSLVIGKRTICVAAASNVGATTLKGEGIAYPALDENVLSIGAHNELGYKSQITPPEGKIDFLALGENVWAPSATDDRALTCSTGTSCATPAVTGLICLIIQYARDVMNDPTYAPSLLQITNILRHLTRDPGAGKCEGEGYGPLIVDSLAQFQTAVINGLQRPP